MKRIQVIMIRNKKYGAVIRIPKVGWDYDYYNNYFIRSFNTIEELVGYLKENDNLKRFWEVKGLTKKEEWILNKKLLCFYKE